ncbi:hypothetical protein HPB51_022763 [Rhipicephalus microplus]|uniref:Uncharacterized protein n=1 Tax=Rhipicephalus microplus TaxID=6941 RepID=A0A9J6EIS9_RHIMP|nr:cyclin-dependent kinase 1-like [Rhipicephalus microplus]KAH8034310.1 hypothetical protein HPB51_022763 [Rhipicephalus microplus]
MNNYAVMEKIGKARCVLHRVQGKVQVQRQKFRKKFRVKGDEEGVPATAIREVSLDWELKHNIVCLVYVVMMASEATHLVFEYMTMDLRRHLDSRPENKAL